MLGRKPLNEPVRGHIILLLVISGLWCITISAFVAYTPFPMTQYGVRDTIQTRTNKYDVVGIYSHDPLAFTEGFLFDDGRLFESTGRAGKSFIREVQDLNSGQITREYQLPGAFFGEGIAIVGEKLYMLTYKSQRGFIVDKSTFQPLGNFTFNTTTGEGWGMTTDGTHLIVSDGSDRISFWDPSTFQPVKELELSVTFKGSPLLKINELEYIDGKIWANVWFQNTIYCIDAATGVVLEELDLSELPPQVENLQKLKGNDLYNAVMNGIAYDPISKHIFVTGKMWNKIFELQVPSVVL